MHLNFIRMKNTIIFCMFLMMLSCGKDDDSGSNTNSKTSFISMKINGVEWKADVNFYSSAIGGAFLAGVKKDNADKTSVIAIVIPDFNTNSKNEFTKTGKGVLTFGDQIAGSFWSAGNNSSGTGSITVTKSKTAGGSLQVSATFEINTKDANGQFITVTDGVIYNAQVE